MACEPPFYWVFVAGLNAAPDHDESMVMILDRKALVRS